MGLKYVSGDLIEMAKDGHFEVIAHCCNCFCTMGSGIAPQIKNAFPEAYIVDCDTKCGDRSKLGKISVTNYSEPMVVNLYGQYDYRGRKQGKMDLNYDALRSALKAMKVVCKGMIIGLPQIGSGLAGGDWKVIERIIKEELNGEDVTIVLYKKP